VGAANQTQVTAAGAGDGAFARLPLKDQSQQSLQVPLEDNASPKLHLITVLRAPVDRIMSEFFFVRSACANANRTENSDFEMLGGWLDGYPRHIRRAICNGDLLTFGTDPSSLAVNQQTYQLADYKVGFKGQIREPLGSVGVERALFRLRTAFRIVLVQEQLVPHGLALLDYTFGLHVSRFSNVSHAELLDSARVSQFSDKSVRKGSWRPGGLRQQMEANLTLLAAIRRANAADVQMHNEAKRIFAESIEFMRAAS
jgi:hypothetical protein